MARQSGLNATRDDWSDFARWCVGARRDRDAGRTLVRSSTTSRHLEASNDAAAVPRRVAAIRDWHRASGLTSTHRRRTRPASRSRVRSGTNGGHRRTRCRSTSPSSHRCSPRYPSAWSGLRDRAHAARRIRRRSASLRARLPGRVGSHGRRRRAGHELDAGPHRDPVRRRAGPVPGAGLAGLGRRRRADGRARRSDRSTATGDSVSRASARRRSPRMVQRAAERAGLDESRYSALSLRLGMLASARPG